MTGTGGDPDLARLVERVVQRIDPVAIHLFGSRATGGADDESAYDLLIVVDDDFPAGRATVSTALSLVDDLGLPVDPVMVRAGDFSRRRRDIGTLCYQVDRHGVLVHERGQPSRVA